MENLKVEINNLFQNGFKTELKRDKIQMHMSPPARDIYLKNATYYTDAAVAILIYRKNGNWFFPLIERASNNRDRHSGQISLPGGKFESSDIDLLNCSVRELKEEIGVDSSEIEFLAELNELLIPVSNFKVHPYIFSTKYLPNFNIQQSEVKNLIEIKLNDLIDNKNSEIGEIELANGVKLQNVPYFFLNSHKIWGATAMILNEFKNVCIKLKTIKSVK